MKHGKRVWCEDDATPGTEGHVTVQGAWERLFGKGNRFADATVWRREDVGDGEFLLMDNEYVVYLSYPGNSAIYAPAETTP